MAWLKKGIEKTIEEVFLRNIKAKSLEEVNEWFKKSYKNGYRIDKLKEAVSLAEKFKNKPVKIIGDYDGDGVNSTAILYTSLLWAGFQNVSYRIPKRFSEGFGINESIIDEVDNGLIITCDNGVAQIDAIKKAKEKGLTVIIIDHHLPNEDEETGKAILPPADVIINPNAISGSADFNGYCGAGLSYRFACELLKYQKGLCHKLLPFAAIGTVTDVMELREENYVIVRNGIKALLNQSSVTTGLYALMSAFELTRHISAHDIGFKIGPALNAASRMKDDGAKDAVELLIYDGPYQNAIPMAEKLIRTNDARKEQKKDALKLAHSIIEEDCLYGEIPLMLYIPNVNEGIIGIVAGSLCEEFKVPAIVVTDTPEGYLKGSGRSCGNYHMKKKLDNHAHLFLKYGGHEGAAGLSLPKENFAQLKNLLISDAEDFKYISANDIYYDLEIEATQIPAAIETLKKFEPFGEGNAAPVFKANNFSVTPRMGTYVKFIGPDSDIAKIYSKSVTAIGFDMKGKIVPEKPFKQADLIGTLSDNYFRGQVEHQIEFIDFKKKEVNKIETPLANRLKKISMSMQK